MFWRGEASDSDTSLGASFNLSTGSSTSDTDESPPHIRQEFRLKDSNDTGCCGPMVRWGASNPA